MQVKKNSKKIKYNNMHGITLIALVVTIIILMILAGVSINLVLGNNGIITKAKYAKEQQEMAQIKEKLEMAIMEIDTEEITSGRETTIDTSLEKLPIKLPEITVSKEGNTLKGTYKGYDFTIDENFKVTIDGYNPSEGGNNTPTAYTVAFNGTNVTSNGANTISKQETYTATLTPATGYGISNIVITMGERTLVKNTDYTYTDGTIEIPNVNGNLTITATTLQTVASKRTAELTYFNEKTTLIDSNGNIIKVPEGFKIAEDSGINVTEGIVIEDNDVKSGIGNNRGNQYVWIPVGNGIKKSDNTTVDITLGRYDFADGENDMAEDEVTPLAKGTPILVQNINDYTNQTNDIKIDTYFYEDITQRPGKASNGTDGLNATSLSILNFKTSVENNEGYYIARYEASYGTDKKANSKVSTGTPETSSGSSYAPTEEGALWNNITQIDAATASRGLYTTATTDLINSYAWDTAIVYIQAFSEDPDYSYQTSKNKSGPVNTGINGDELCKINDMASNASEWTTEYSTLTLNSTAYPCIRRGGLYNNTNFYVSNRNNDDATFSYNDITFRTELYM